MDPVIKQPRVQRGTAASSKSQSGSTAKEENSERAKHSVDFTPMFEVYRGWENKLPNIRDAAPPETVKKDTSGKTSESARNANRSQVRAHVLALLKESEGHTLKIIESRGKKYISYERAPVSPAKSANSMVEDFEKLQQIKAVFYLYRLTEVDMPAGKTVNELLSHLKEKLSEAGKPSKALPGDGVDKKGVRPLRRQQNERVRQIRQEGAQGKSALATPKMASVQAFATMDLAGVREEYKASLCTLQAWLRQLSRYGIDEKNRKADQAACAKLKEGLTKGELDGSFAALLTLTEKLAASDTRAAQIFWAAVPPVFPKPEDVSKQRQALARAFARIRIFPAPAERNRGAEAESKRRSLLAISRAAFQLYGPTGTRKFNIQDLQFDRKGRMVISYQSRKGTNQLLVEERKGKLAFVEPLKGRLARMSKGARQNVLDRLAQGIQQADRAYALGSEGNEARAKRLFSAISMATDLVAQIPANGFESFLRANVQDSKYDLSPQGISNEAFRKAYREQDWAAIKALNSSPIPLIEALLVEAGKDIAGIFQGRFTFSQMQEFFSRFSSSSNSWTDLPEGNVKAIGLMLDVFRPDKELVYCICKSLNLFRDQVLARSSNEEMRKLGANLYQMVQALFGFTRERANVEKVTLVKDDSKLNDQTLVKPLMLLNSDAKRAGFELTDQADLWFGMKL